MRKAEGGGWAAYDVPFGLEVLWIVSESWEQGRGVGVGERQTRQGSFPSAGKHLSEGKGQLCSELRVAGHRSGWKATSDFPGAIMGGREWRPS